MNLLQLRQKLRTESGRFDLVNSDGTDNGADFYIYEGSRHLDRLETVEKSLAYNYSNLPINHYFIPIPFCRAVQEVWVFNLSARWQLEKKTFQWLRSEYAQTFLQSDSGSPLYYAPVNVRTVPAVEDIPGTLAVMASGMDVIGTSDHDYNGIIVLPRTSAALNVEIGGLFYQPEMVADTDWNYWSHQHPLLLIMATSRHLEVMNRNTQGVNDWDRAISTYITGIGKDDVEGQIAEYNEMEG